MIYPFSIILGALTENHYFLGNHYFCGNHCYFGGILLLVQFVNAFVQTLKKKKKKTLMIYGAIISSLGFKLNFIFQWNTFKAI